MAATVEQIKSLRESTGAGILECKQALEASDGNFDKATETLRQKGFASVAKRANRETSEGVIESYIHNGGQVGALVELGCETDFVARTSEFRELAHEIAMQVAAMAPIYLSADEIAEDDPRPAAQITLLQQSYIKDGSRSIGDLVQELAAKVGENVKVVRFSRLSITD